MTASHFPLAHGVTWTYAATNPISCQLVTLRVRTPLEIEVEDMLTGAVRGEWAWTLEDSGREVYRFVIEREHGIEFLRRRRFGKPERQAIVVTEDYRWAGDECWSRPYWHYDLQTLRYRRVGDEEVTVSAGVFRCVKILLDEGETGTVWLAPGVGIVRTVGAVQGLWPARFEVLELHSYALPSAAGARLSYCGTCGHEVDPYLPGSVSNDDIFIHG